MSRLEDVYLGQPISEFVHNGGDPDEYARLVFAGEIFPGEDPTDKELGIETEEDLRSALRAAVGEYARLAALERHRAGTQFQPLDPNSPTLTVQVRMPASLVAAADERAQELGVTRSDVVRGALTTLLAVED